MKIINKSGNDYNPEAKNTFYIRLAQWIDVWEYNEFQCDLVAKYTSESDAVADAQVGQVIAKVTLVAKIV